MNSNPVRPHPIQRIFFIPKEKLVFHKNDGVDMKSPLSLLVIYNRKPLGPAWLASVVGIDPAKAKILNTDELLS